MDETANKYAFKPEGYGIRIQIKTIRDLAMLKQLAAIKTAH